MRKQLDSKYERGRIIKGAFATHKNSETRGAFFIPSPVTNDLMLCLSSGPNIWWNGGWDHVSISIKIPPRTPTWEEMCFVKNIFWNDDECVIQYHPPKKDCINCHPRVLHLWKPINKEIPMPPKEFV